MAVFICVELESIVGLPEIMNCLLEKSIKFTVSKDRRSLCDTCSAKDDSLQLSSTTSITPVIPTSTPSSISLEQIESYPRSESVDSEVHDMVKSEDCTAQFSDIQTITPVNDDMDETDLVACGSELLQQVSANFSSYQERPKNFTDSEMSLIREKGAGSAPKQCQLCGHWITAKNVRAHVATHLTIRRYESQRGFNRL
ncbi:unnamed protein product [Haemonchus placei]|uniref:C2H2-type domain-containing protein n=1 Tax=Haemonchus placei TaxID=6290 RepID=A0A0N4W2F9_HAEPC|nr:unnamed protein product [Haemonchus placei]